MSRNFVAASSQYLSNAAAVLSAYPITIACWFKASTAHTGALVVLDDGVSKYNGIGYRNDIPGAIAAFSTGALTSYTSNTVSTGVWAHAGGVFSASNNRVAYLNGSAGTADTNNNTGGMGTTTGIGQVIGVQFFNGDIAQAAIWNVALTTAEMQSLASGLSPLLIRFSALQTYWILAGTVSPEPDSVGTFPLTLNNAPTQGSTDPNIIYSLEFTNCTPKKAFDCGRKSVIGY